MSAVRGRVRGNHVETDTALPDGAEVIVLTGDDAAPFDLAEEEILELADRMRAAEAGPSESAASLFARLRSRS